MPANWWESDPVVEELPDFTGLVRSGASRAGSPITLEQMQREALGNETQEQRIRRLMREGEAQGADIAIEGAPPLLAATALPVLAPGVAAWLGKPVGGAVIGGAQSALRGGSPEEVLKAAGVGALAGPTIGKGLGAVGKVATKVGGKLLPFLLRLGQNAAPAVEAAAPAAAAETAAVAPAVAARIAAAEAAPVAAAAPVASRAVRAAAPVVEELAEAEAAPLAGSVSTARLGPEQLAEYRAGIEPVQIFEKGASAESLKLMQLAKESGADYGEKVWFVIKDGVPKIVSPAQAGAAKRAGQATTWVANVLEGGAPAAGAAPAAAAAPIAAAAREPAAAITPKVLPDVAKQIGNRLRQIAETSAGNKRIVREAIKTEWQQAGFPSAEAMTEYVFSQRTRL